MIKAMLNITQTTHDKRMGRIGSYFLLEELNKYLNFRNSISYKSEILSCWIEGRMHIAF